jgi:hypothetical protein
MGRIRPMASALRVRQPGERGMLWPARFPAYGKVAQRARSDLRPKRREARTVTSDGAHGMAWLPVALRHSEVDQDPRLSTMGPKGSHRVG